MNDVIDAGVALAEECGRLQQENNSIRINSVLAERKIRNLEQDNRNLVALVRALNDENARLRAQLKSRRGQDQTVGRLIEQRTDLIAQVEGLEAQIHEYRLAEQGCDELERQLADASKRLADAIRLLAHSQQRERDLHRMIVEKDARIGGLLDNISRLMGR